MGHVCFSVNLIQHGISKFCNMISIVYVQKIKPQPSATDLPLTDSQEAGAYGREAVYTLDPFHTLI